MSKSAVTVTVQPREVPTVESAVTQHVNDLRFDLGDIPTDATAEPQTEWEEEALASLMRFESLAEILHENEGTTTPVQLRLTPDITDEFARALRQFGKDIVANAQADKQQMRDNRDDLFDVAERAAGE